MAMSSVIRCWGKTKYTIGNSTAERSVAFKKKKCGWLENILGNVKSQIMPIIEENEKMNPMVIVFLTCDSIKSGLMYDIIASAKEIKNVITAKKITECIRFMALLCSIS